MTQWIFVALGGALGAVARYGVAVALPTDPHGGMPWATLAVNVAGSLLLGVIAALALSGKLDDNLRLFVGTGFCGALTTFSTFSVEAVALVRAGQTSTAAAYVGANLLVCLVVVWVVFAIVSPTPASVD